MLQLHLGVLLMSGSGLFAKFIDIPAVDIITYRSIFTALFLFAVLKITRCSVRLKSFKDYKIALALGLLAGIHWATYFMSIQKTSVAIGMITMFTYPVLTVLIEPLLNKQLPKLKDILLSSVVLIGISLLFPNLWQSNISVSQDYLLGIVLGLLSALCFALRNIGISHYFKQYSGGHSMFYQFLISAIILLPFVELPPSELNGKSIELLLLLSIFFTAAPHVLFASSLAKLPASTVGIIAYLQPLYGILLAAVLLAERPSFMTIFGGIIILSAAIYKTLQSSKVP
ncbi:MAG: EamA family transporter [Gammaproteobacteria bacterium]|nr:EamA family transporter [Gammaproteobacteria bacterium]